MSKLADPVGAEYGQAIGILRPIEGKTELLQGIGLVSVFHSLLQYELVDGIRIFLGLSDRYARFLV